MIAELSAPYGDATDRRPRAAARDICSDISRSMPAAGLPVYGNTSAPPKRRRRRQTCAFSRTKKRAVSYHQQAASADTTFAMRDIQRKSGLSRCRRRASAFADFASPASFLSRAIMAQRPQMNTIHSRYHCTMRMHAKRRDTKMPHTPRSLTLGRAAITWQRAFSGRDDFYAHAAAHCIV